ncbi:NAD(P)/FAD-dependent oxidoreductase [Streptomyces sp. CNQ085]|uniref:NAD(P)/FAD-dependent oxidoreductase n=1 Tax=Streptomyces sp. CNQ085 TaxID=2886944 RepID=UPI001F50F204|nr:FAD-dependent oxidoreductase [Streptomyces sp. CNQ085]MCI0383323.1 FAD-dependent oxidoreductase [Streptomyces sp. CNQ085]
MTPTKRVVVIGGGMAAARLAGQLSAAGVPGTGGVGGAAVDLTVVGEEPHAPYNRVLLAEVLAGRYAPEVIGLPAPAATRWLRGVRAVRLDRAERLVRCDDGSSLPYDTLVLATGSNPVLPPLRGLFPDGGGRELPRGVHPFRTMADCRALAAAARPGVRAVVVGGGPLGVSAARALAGRGAYTVLAHQGEHLMEHHLDARASALLRGHLEDLGVEVHTECRVRGLLTSGHAGEGAGGGAVARGVELADGYRLEAELTVLTCGARPRTGLAGAAGLEVRDGIVVDDELRTDDPRIHAVGDCAEHGGRVYGLACAAQEQADVLARVLLADGTTDGPAGGVAGGTTDGAATGTRPPAYTGTRALTRLTLAPPPAGPGSALDLASFGETVPRAGDEVVRLADATRGVYRKVVVRGDRLVGGILLGDLGTVGALARAWEDGEPLSSAPPLHLLTNDGGL